MLVPRCAVNYRTLVTSCVSSAHPKTQVQYKYFAESAVTFLKEFGFDGLDLDWEPAFPLKPFKVNAYAELVSIMKKWINASSTKASPFLLSAALYSNINKANYMYNITQLGETMDFVTVMTYDYHLFIQGVDMRTGYKSPLYTAKGEPSYWSVEKRKRFMVKGKEMN